MVNWKSKRLSSGSVGSAWLQNKSEYELEIELNTPTFILYTSWHAYPHIDMDRITFVAIKTK